MKVSTVVGILFVFSSLGCSPPPAPSEQQLRHVLVSNQTEFGLFIDCLKSACIETIDRRGNGEWRFTHAEGADISSNREYYIEFLSKHSIKTVLVVPSSGEVHLRFWSVGNWVAYEERGLAFAEDLDTTMTIHRRDHRYEFEEILEPSGIEHWYIWSYKDW